MNDSVSIKDAVADFLRNFRREHNLALDAIARTGRSLGTDWGVQSIRNIETGKSALSLETLFALRSTLNELTGANLTLSDLFGAAKSLVLYPGAEPISRETLDGFLSGAPLVLDSASRTASPTLASLSLGDGLR